MELEKNSAHVEPPPIPLIKEPCHGKSDKDFVNLNFCRDPTSILLYLFEFRMSLFDHDKPEKFLLFVKNFNTTLPEIGTLNMDAKIQYLCTLVYGEALRYFDLLSADMGNTETLKLDYYIKGLELYYPLVNLLSKQKLAMRRGI